MLFVPLIHKNLQLLPKTVDHLRIFLLFFIHLLDFFSVDQHHISQKVINYYAIVLLFLDDSVYFMEQLEDQDQTVFPGCDHVLPTGTEGNVCCLSYMDILRIHYDRSLQSSKDD
jgi:hypothetical protein